MAFTVTTKKKTVFGDMRVHILDVTTDGAEDNIATGMSVIEGFAVGAQSIATSAFSLNENVDSSGTAANGTIGASGLASGDAFFLTVYGR
jgi:hypothetical protein